VVLDYVPQSASIPLTQPALLIEPVLNFKDVTIEKLGMKISLKTGSEFKALSRTLKLL
jgi:hypothetical protein